MDSASFYTLKKEHDALKESNKTTKEDLESCKEEFKLALTNLDECKYGPGRLLDLAVAHFDQNAHEKVLHLADQSNKKHIGTPENKKIQTLAKKSANIIAKEKRQEELRIKREKEKKDREQRQALRNVRVKKDEIKNITWYKHKNSPRYVNSRTSLHTYFAVFDHGIGPLRLVLQYTDDSWLFIQKYSLKIDNSLFTILAQRNQIDRDSHYGGISEHFDQPASPDHVTIHREDFSAVEPLKLLEEITTSKSVKIRFEGKSYYKDHKLSQKDINAVAEMLKVHTHLKAEMR